MAHLKPLDASASPELAEDFAIFEEILGFVPNSLLTMQRKPEMVKAFGILTKATMSKENEVDLGFMRLIAHFASRAVGCQYCEAHSLIAANIHGVSQEKLDAIWEYKTNDLYTEADVEILGAVCLYGFLNRWNDSMATDLEESPLAMGKHVLSQGGWDGGKHVK